MSIEQSIIFNFAKAAPKIELDAECPSCKTGKLAINMESCACHIWAPCSGCASGKLQCNECFEEFEA